jgi:trk system potassium uptake protein TrkH
MIREIDRHDWHTVFHLSGPVFYFFGFVLFVPALIALFMQEWSSFFDFWITGLLFIIVGLLLKNGFRHKHDATWLHGMGVAAFCWLGVMFIGAIPYYFSGHFLSYLDCCFDMMSGMTTTGLILIQNVDHLPVSINIWRHILTFIGGQGIVIIALSFVPVLGIGFKAMVGEGKEERMVPNVRDTGRAIWQISLIYLGIGTLLFFVVGLFAGLKPGWSLFHGLNLFMSTWSTGGFAPQSQNVLYYHNFPIEIFCTLFSIIGSMNFGLHYYVWFKQRKELIKDIETKSLMITMTITFMIIVYGLLKQGIYPAFLSLVRKSLFLLVSGHTTTGTMTIYTVQFVNLWGPVALMGLTIAMAFGGSSASTAGGFKGLRIGIAARGIIADIKKLFTPSGSIVVEKYNHIEEGVLSDKLVRSAFAIILLYIFIYVGGTVLGMMHGYPAMSALFESVSAGSNSGLSCGITAVSMPWDMKVYYILAMWLGRLEFTAIIVFVTMIVRTLIQKRH